MFLKRSLTCAISTHRDLTVSGGGGKYKAKDFAVSKKIWRKKRTFLPFHDKFFSVWKSMGKCRAPKGGSPS